jgi:chemotaxis protein MotB
VTETKQQAAEAPEEEEPFVKKEREPDPEPPGAPEWVVTFTDMISLLVTFFVLLMTFSSMEEYDLLRFQSLLNGNRGVLRSMHGPRMIETPPDDIIADSHPLDGALAPHARPSEELPEEISKTGTELQEDTVQIDLNEIGDGLLVTWDADASYAPGVLEPNPRLTDALKEVGEVLRFYPHVIVVEAHTASDFTPTSTYPDAQAFSLARARRAAEVFCELGGISPERVQLAGYGADRPKALNDSAKGRRTNRRIELRILSVPRSREERLEEIRQASKPEREGR